MKEEQPQMDPDRRNKDIVELQAESHLRKKTDRFGGFLLRVFSNPQLELITRDVIVKARPMSPVSITRPRRAFHPLPTQFGDLTIRDNYVDDGLGELISTREIVLFDRRGDAFSDSATVLGGLNAADRLWTPMGGEVRNRTSLNQLVSLTNAVLELNNAELFEPSKPRFTD